MGKNAGASRRQTRRAHDRASVKPIVADNRNPYAYQTRRQYDEQLKRNLRAGFFLGLAVGLAILVAVMFLWAVPTVDGCVESLKAMQEAAYA